MTKYLTQLLNYFRFVFLFTFLYGCNSDRQEYSKLEKYYNENTLLHTNTSDSLINFCKANKTDVILRKSNPGKSIISFQVHIGDSFYPIQYDSSLHRSDIYPDKTIKYLIPVSIITNFKSSIYTAISADSAHTFFGGKWDVKFQIGTQGDSQYGVLISSDTSICKLCDKKLSPNTCLTKWTVP